MSNIQFSQGHALLIGVGSADLPMTVRDATALTDVLVNPRRAGYPREQVELLIGESATRQKILEACDRLIDRTSNNPDATVIVYFSGHGVRLERDAEPTEYFLVPYDYNDKDRKGTAIFDLEFSAKIKSIKCSKLVVFLDCCHAGGIPIIKKSGQRLVKSAVPPDLLSALKGGTGRVLIASSKEDEVSYCDSTLSIFTTCLLEALEGKVAKTADGYCRILNIISYLLEQVPMRTADYSNGTQHPFVNLIKDLDENFPLCYYAGGDVEKKFLDSESGSTSSDSTTEKDAPWKERIKQIKIEQLQMEIEQLHQDCQILTRKIGDLKKELNSESYSMWGKVYLDLRLDKCQATLTEKKNKVKKLTEELNDIC